MRALLLTPASINVGVEDTQNKLEVCWLHVALQFIHTCESKDEGPWG